MQRKDCRRGWHGWRLGEREGRVRLGFGVGRGYGFFRTAGYGVKESTFHKIVAQGGPAQRPIFRIFTLVLVPRAAFVAPFSSPRPWIQVSSGRCFYTDDPPPSSVRLPHTRII